MRENDWTATIGQKLQSELPGLSVESLRRIPYSQEIESYSEDWQPNYMNPMRFETDMVVFENVDGIVKPRVIVEAKLDRITTHDAITYSYKAEKHKAITPYVRYGIMIGEREQYPLPGRLFRHGTNFDFMFSFKGDTPDGMEWEAFVALVQREVLYSRQTEEMLHESRSPGRKRYYMMEKQLVLAEMTEAEAELGRDLKPEDWL